MSLLRRLRRQLRAREHLEAGVESDDPAERERFDRCPPDASALATAIHAEKLGHDDVRLGSFDAKVVEAYAALHPLSPEIG